MYLMLYLAMLQSLKYFLELSHASASAQCHFENWFQVTCEVNCCCDIEALVMLIESILQVTNNEHFSSRRNAATYMCTRGFLHRTKRVGSSVV